MIEKHNWGQLSAIQIGGVICMPVLMIGQTLIHHYGFISAVVAVVLGNAFLFLLALIAARMSVESKKNTMENAVDYFGKEGVILFSVAMILMLVGWFAIQLNMMTLGVVELFSLHDSPSSSILLNIALGLLITVAALYGVRGIELLANISMPLLIATIGYAVYTVDDLPVAKLTTESLPVSFGGISLVIAMAIGFVIDLPTYYRHALSYKHAYISIAIVVALSLPLLEMVGVYLAAANPDGTFIDVFKRSNSTMWNIWVASFLVLAGWTTNNVNLYSGVVCMELILKKWPTYILTVLFGVVGTSLACVDLLAHLNVVLEMIGILIGSMGGVVLTRYLLSLKNGLELHKKYYTIHLIAWVIGLAVGMVSWVGYSITGISVLDATLGASLGTLLILIKGESYEKVYS